MWLQSGYGYVLSAKDMRQGEMISLIESCDAEEGNNSWVPSDIQLLTPRPSLQAPFSRLVYCVEVVVAWFICVYIGASPSLAHAS